MAHEIVVADALPIELHERKRIERSLTRLSKLATLLDDQFELPIVKQRIGLDPIIGLVPGAGDWVSWFVSVYIILEALRLKVPLKVLFGIGKSITLDFVVGYVPGVGDVIDVLLKANKRSVNLLLKHFDAKPAPVKESEIIIPEKALAKPTSSPWIRYPLGIMMIFFFGMLALIPITLSYLIFQWWTG